jgi:ribosomal 50S subunit-recycling heat shock protein
LPFFFYSKHMRLDIFLKLSRLIHRRNLAQEFCDAGLITVNGALAKSAKEVRIGDQIGITRGGKRVMVKITAIPDKKQVAKNAAADLYELIERTADENEPVL